MATNHQPQKVGGIILDGENNLLIVLGKYSKKWGVPKGSLEPSDRTLFEGALREIREETGLKLKIFNQENQKYWSVNRARLYLLQVSDEVKPELSPNDDREIEKATWLDLNDKVKIDIVKQNSNKMLLAILRKLEHSILPN